MDWLNKISVTCFAASYLVVFGLEVSRVYFKAKLRPIARIGFAVAGLFAHTVYMLYQGNVEIGETGIWLSNWQAWCYATAWVLAAAYFWFSIQKSQSVVGLFVLPLVLLLIAVGIYQGDQNSFTVNEAKSGWNAVHGFSLLLGTVSVGLGFIFGVIYLIQANRLRKKKVQSKLFQLPSLEWLQRYSHRSLIFSAALMGLGFVSGVAINLIQRNGMEGPAIAWTSPVIWTSAILFVWLLAISLLGSFYKPAQQGRKVAYLVVSSFLFLLFELVVVWMAGHAAEPVRQQNTTAKPIENQQWVQSNDSLTSYQFAKTTPLSTTQIDFEVRK